MKIGKRIVGMLLTVAMLLCLMPMTMPVLADYYGECPNSGCAGYLVSTGTGAIACDACGARVCSNCGRYIDTAYSTECASCGLYAPCDHYGCIFIYVPAYDQHLILCDRCGEILYSEDHLMNENMLECEHCRFSWFEYCSNSNYGGVTITGQSAYVDSLEGEVYFPSWISQGQREERVTAITAEYGTNYRAFTGAGLPEYCKEIGSETFADCKLLSYVRIPKSLICIGDDAFTGCTSLETVYYAGTRKQWDAIEIGSGNESLLNAKLICQTCATCNYEGVVTKEPTKTETGEKIYTCTICGDTYTEILPTLFYGANVDMGNSLNLNFYFYKEQVGTDGYVEFVRTFADGTTETTEKNLSEFDLNGSYYQITYPDIAAMEMNDTVSITVFDKDGNAVSETKTDSICTYVRRALDKITDPVARTMYVDMLNYGAAAQQNFDYDTANLANSILTDDEKAEGTQSLAPMTNNYTRSNNNYYGTNFDLENEIKLNLYVLASAMGENGYAEISYTDFKGEEVTKTVTQYSTNGDYYVFTPDFVVAADGRCLLNIKFYKADGTEVVAVTDSMESYVARAVEKNPEKYNWMQQMMIYSDSARAYLLQSN